MLAGFQDPSRDAARAFRAALTAMSRPGTIVTLEGVAAPAPLSPAAAGLLLTLADRTTGIWLAPGLSGAAVRDWITFHTAAPFVAPEEACFAIGAWPELCPVARFPVGQADYPDRSATLIVEMAALRPVGTRLTGPGIREEAALSLPDGTAFRANAALAPQGLDFFFTCGARLAAVPRSTRVEDC